MNVAPIIRGGVAGLLAFGLFGLLTGWVMAALTSDWSTDTINAVGFLVLGVIGAAGGAAGAWQAERGGLRGWAVLLGAALGPLIGIALVIAGDPRASLATVLGVLVVLAGAAAGGRAFSARSRGRRRRG